MENKKRISIVVPVYNEGNNIIDTYAEILKVYTGISPRYDLEIIFVNDGSVDDSWAIIQSLAQQDSRILGLCLSRNFGHQFALSA
jgi:glycosyltransferase involved in cell wall biosynthesis